MQGRMKARDMGEQQAHQGVGWCRLACSPNCTAQPLRPTAKLSARRAPRTHPCPTAPSLHLAHLLCVAAGLVLLAQVGSQRPPGRPRRACHLS